MYIDDDAEHHCCWLLSVLSSARSSLFFLRQHGLNQSTWPYSGLDRRKEKEICRHNHHSCGPSTSYPPSRRNKKIICRHIREKEEEKKEQYDWQKEKKKRMYMK
jgi:hypothetical protein